ncbi:hypothetical protein [Methylobacterium platani]|uniref:hypothetical protein n=1 Tax=Methylobacterium platani TaxID=427683 RepID=UPI0012E2C98C|nr:hypothetical protein [Methylobacterium platani]
MSTQKRNSALDALTGGTPQPAAPASPVAAEPTQPAQAAQPEVQKSSAPPSKPAKDIAKVMLYLHPKVARKFKEIAFTEDRKAHDVYLDALDAYLKQQGHGGLESVKKR